MDRREPIRLVVFDWDGTLLDSIGSIVECTEVALRDLGLEVPTRQRIRAVIGLGFKESVERLYPGADGELSQQILERYRHFWWLDYSRRSQLFPGIQGALQDLVEQNVQLGVATAKSRRGLDRELERTGLEPLIHASRTADETREKPDPQMLVEIMDELAAEPRETLMVGDTTYDVQMAHNAGVQAVGVTSGSHSASRLQEARPLACLDSAASIPEWLRRNGG